MQYMLAGQRGLYMREGVRRKIISAAGPWKVAPDGTVLTYRLAPINLVADWITSTDAGITMAVTTDGPGGVQAFKTSTDGTGAGVTIDIDAISIPTIFWIEASMAFSRLLTAAGQVQFVNLQKDDASNQWLMAMRHTGTVLSISRNVNGTWTSITTSFLANTYYAFGLFADDTTNNLRWSWAGGNYATVTGITGTPFNRNRMIFSAAPNGDAMWHKGVMVYQNAPFAATLTGREVF